MDLDNPKYFFLINTPKTKMFKLLIHASHCKTDH